MPDVLCWLWKEFKHEGHKGRPEDTKKKVIETSLGETSFCGSSRSRYAAKNAATRPANCYSANFLVVKILWPLLGSFVTFVFKFKIGGIGWSAAYQQRYRLIGTESWGWV
jgi:hypothetical protein